MSVQDIKKVGLKVTAPRLKILKLLENSKEQKHFTAEEVHDILKADGEEIGLATVYRVLNQFSDVGLVIRQHFNDQQTIFERNRGGHHDHIICLDCDEVVEFCDDQIEILQDSIAGKHGFLLEAHSLVLYGRCQQKPCPYNFEKREEEE
jgi:Fur family ferric uptake transcriptional regulator